MVTGCPHLDPVGLPGDCGQSGIERGIDPLGRFMRVRILAGAWLIITASRDAKPHTATVNARSGAMLDGGLTLRGPSAPGVIHRHFFVWHGLLASREVLMGDPQGGEY